MYLRSSEMTNVLYVTKGYKSKSSWFLLLLISKLGDDHGKVLGKRNFAGIGYKEKYCTRHKDFQLAIY